jgi:hypothetical protein
MLFGPALQAAPGSMACRKDGRAPDVSHLSDESSSERGFLTAPVVYQLKEFEANLDTVMVYSW